MALLSLKCLLGYIWVLTLSFAWASLVFTTALLCSKATRLLCVYMCVCIKASLEHEIMPDWRFRGLLPHAVGGFALIIKSHFYWVLKASLWGS